MLNCDVVQEPDSSKAITDNCLPNSIKSVIPMPVDEDPATKTNNYFPVPLIIPSFTNSRITAWTTDLMFLSSVWSSVTIF